MKSPEGIPWHEYSFLGLVLATPFTVVLELYFAIMRRLTSCPKHLDLSGLPRNCIIVTFHGESYLDPLCRPAWKALAKTDFFWLGFHGMLSYLGYFSMFGQGMSCFRFKRGGKVRPYEQTVRALKDRSDQAMLLRTDSGGPYWQVRKSLIRMARETNRPIVGLRWSCTKQKLFNDHKLALPGAKIDAHFSRVITPDEYLELTVTEAREYVQEILGGKTFIPKEEEPPVVVSNSH